MAPSKDRPAPLATSTIATTPAGRAVPPKQRKVLLMGSRGVGKSSIALQFVDSHFPSQYYPTIEEKFTKEFKYKGKEYQLEIQDTAGHDEFSLLNDKYAVGWHGYIIVYSVTSRVSFDLVTIIRDKILAYLSIDKVPMCIVGNKSDLEVQRVVSEDEGIQLARSLGCAFTEASAKVNDNVEGAFKLVVQEIEKELNPDSAKTVNPSQSWGGWFKGVFGGTGGSGQTN
ncbi:MAG: GTP-binding protein [Cyphobasidiales sp. Tagirdzhanova-0007]|nr:MAG: GTP-binding protein [Cyphobasidiales sp. Tagirdzhanova-0007]